ncbi:hypothetical protein JQX13_50745 [Archangium violaceum]|uniref:hypothetical protein n=1 Tax=Archangium violaceum TaxID=83451 RepID=UPI00193B54ED|nr:hypothetical protein [Archangium violaceum]QRK08138.1 hypothetical protein JQX13_50745 [Archangium violaceum]
MSRTRLLLTGLLAGAMAFGTACKSDSAAQRGSSTDPAQTPAENQGGTTPDSTSPGGTGGAGTEERTPGIYKGYTVPQEDRGSTGGSGYEDPVTDPDAIDTSGSRLEPRSQDDLGTGGAGAEEDDSSTTQEPQ